MLTRACLTLTLMLGATAARADEVKLQWKFKEGDTYYVENVTKTKQSLGAGGKSNETNKTTTAVNSAVKENHCMTCSSSG